MLDSSKPGALSRLICPCCEQALPLLASVPKCLACGAVFPVLDGTPVLLPKSDQHIKLWRGQLRLLLSQASAAHERMQQLADSPLSTPVTNTRLLALAEAVFTQVSDIERIMSPALGGPSETPARGLPKGTVEYLGCLLRDWAWPSEPHRENRRAHDAVASALDGHAVGQTLVLGAGGCRLAYDVHNTHSNNETVVLDIDPFLFSPARRVLFGETVQLTETAMRVSRLDGVKRTWQLCAPDGPLDPQEFHLLFADGTRPPFAANSFDTVITQWFIDQAPSDLADLIARIGRLLRRGGKWINHGPLIYPESVPFERRFVLGELAELAQANRLSLGEIDVNSQPYLISPLSGAGRYESVVTFAGTKA